MKENNLSSANKLTAKAPKGFWRYVVLCSLLFAIAGTVLLKMLMAGFSAPGFHMMFATFLGLFFTSLVTVALMALVFYSDRAGFDGEVTLKMPDEK